MATIDSPSSLFKTWPRSVLKQPKEESSTVKKSVSFVNEAHLETIFCIDQREIGSKQNFRKKKSTG